MKSKAKKPDHSLGLDKSVEKTIRDLRKNDGHLAHPQVEKSTPKGKDKC